MPSSAMTAATPSSSREAVHGYPQKLRTALLAIGPRKGEKNVSCSRTRRMSSDRTTQAMAIIISFAAARMRRIEALHREMAECAKAVRACRPGSWHHAVCAIELDDAIRRLSEAQGMPRRSPQHEAQG